MEERAQPKKEMSRELGLLSLVSIGVGTMVGVEVFILPGIVVTQAGPLALVSYVVAPLLALTAGLSIAELASAMPETGGSFHFVDRSLGPLMGSIAGLGTWMVSVFKGSFAAVGFGEYVHAYLGLPMRSTALLLIVGLLAVNAIGAQHGARLQTIIVVIVLSGMAAYAFSGLPMLDLGNFEVTTTLPNGPEVLLAGSALAIFSYVGVVKMTAVSGEVRDPGRTIPRGILLSMGAVTLLYLVAVAVILGVLGPQGIGNPATAVVDAARQTMGPTGGILLTIAAVFALASMANAAVLLAGRYPFAMAHDHLVPPSLGRLNQRFLTPDLSIGLSAALMLLLALLMDVRTLAEVTSSFTLLLFILINAAVIVMRRAGSSGYRPPFRCPGYPWVQAAGILGSITFGAFIEPLAQVVLIVFVAAGILWYVAYARGRTQPRGELREILRQEAVRRSLARARANGEFKGRRILLPMDSTDHARDLFHLIAWVLGSGPGFIRAIKVEEMPFQTPLDEVLTLSPRLPQVLANEVARDSHEFGIQAEFYDVYVHEPVKALLEVARRDNFDLLVLDWDSEFLRLIGDRGLRRVLHTPKLDVIIFRDRGLRDGERVLLASARGPYDELELAIARRAAQDAQITLLRVLAEDSTAAQKQAERQYHEQLRHVLKVPTESKLVRSDEPVKAIVAEAAEHDLLIMRVAREPKLWGSVFGRTVDSVASLAPCSMILTRMAESRRRRFIRWLLHRSIG